MYILKSNLNQAQNGTVCEVKEGYVLLSFMAVLLIVMVCNCKCIYN